jgi:hypothetical protein
MSCATRSRRCSRTRGAVVYIARQLGHGADVSLKVYQHVIDELEDRPALAAEDAIREAREERKALRRQS